MIFAFVGSLIIAFAFYKLGFYAALLAVLGNAGKVAVAVLIVSVAAMLLYRVFWKRPRTLKLPVLPRR